MTVVSMELSGGMELLFGRTKVFPRLELPPSASDDAQPMTMREALQWIRSNLLKERPELFLAGDSVRPGILVLINDCDWELEGQLEYRLRDGDVISFISTLHGG